MGTELLHDVGAQEADCIGDQPAYLARLANLPNWYDASAQRQTARSERRTEASRLDQIEHALTILASVVARLAKEAHQSRLPLRPTECAQRELVESLQARLTQLEERTDQLNVTPLTPEVAEDFAQSVQAIRNSLDALLKRRPKILTTPA